MLKTSARREFEEARHEHDPLIIARMLVVGRDCVVKTQHKFDAASRSIREKIEQSRNRGS